MNTPEYDEAQKRYLELITPNLETHIKNNIRAKKLLAENSRLHNLIEKAYKEGFNEGIRLLLYKYKLSVESFPYVEESFKQFKEVNFKKKR